MSTEKQFHYLHIPVDTTQPITQHTLQYTDENCIEILINTIKQFQSTGKNDTVSVEQMKQDLFKTVKEQNVNVDLSKIDDNLIQQMYNTVTVDQILLYTNKLVTSYTGVAMYVDDRGQLKQLPVNQRATALAQQCAQSIDVLGDVFVARYYDNEDVFKRLDVTLEELEKHSDVIIAIAYASKNNNDVAAVDKQIKQKLGSTTALSLCAIGLFGCYKEAKHRCARCKEISYCGAEHQKMDWKRHKHVCNTNK